MLRIRDSRTTGIIRGEQLYEGNKGIFIEVYCYSKKELKQKYKDEEIINNALSHLGEGGYNILKNNCEHFANRCIFGISKSDQIDKAYKDVDELFNKR